MQREVKNLSKYKSGGEGRKEGRELTKDLWIAGWDFFLCCFYSMISASGLCPSTSVLLVYGMLQIMKSAELQSCFYIDSTFFGAVWSNVCLLQFPLHMLSSEHCRAGVSKLALLCATTVAWCCAEHTHGARLCQQCPSSSLSQLARDSWCLNGSLETPVQELYFSSLSRPHCFGFDFAVCHLFQECFWGA